MKKSKRFYYELFEPGEPITPKPTKVEEAKEKLTATHYCVAIAVLFFGIIKALTIIAQGHH